MVIYELVESMRGRSIVDKLQAMRPELTEALEHINCEEGSVSIKRDTHLIQGRILTPDRRVVTANDNPVGISLAPTEITLTDPDSEPGRSLQLTSLRNYSNLPAHYFSLFLPPLEGLVRTERGNEAVVDAILPAYGSNRLSKDLITKYLFLNATYLGGTPRTPQQIDAGEVWLPSELQEVVDKYFPHIKRFDPQSITG